MAEGSSGSTPDEVGDFESRPTAARVFALDDGGLAPVEEVDGQLRATAPAVSPSVPPEGAPGVGGTIPSGETPTLGWDEISPDRLRESAADQQARGVFGDTEVAPAVGMAWFEVVLGCLLGMAATLGMYNWSEGTLGPFVTVPSIVLGVTLLAIPRHDIRHLGFGLLVSVPVAALLGLGLWYAAEVF